MFLKLNFVLNSMVLFEFASAVITENYLDFDVLNKNLFESLKLHPKLNAAVNLTEEENNFIDKYVNDYFELTNIPSENERKERFKRGLNIPTSYPKDEFGTYTFSGIRLVDDLPIHNASKFEYFQQSNKWFFVTTEESAIGGHRFGFTNLLIFRIQNNTYSRVPQWIIHKVEEFSVHSARNTTYIIVKASDQYFSGVWEFDGLELYHAQNIEMENVTDVGIWETGTEMHMAISSIGFRNQTLKLNETKNYNYTFIYKFNKIYFNLNQIIDKVSSRVLPFDVEGKNFLLLSINNTMDDFLGEYSEIYRYNLESGFYEVYQRIPTYKCKDVKFFSMKSFDGYDSYLIVANYVSGEDDDAIPPIIYKYVNGYFLPFQNLYIENIIEFQTLYYPRDAAFLLLARTEYQGLKTYQYDGWIFQETPHDINSDLGDAKISNAKFGVIENNKTVLVLGFDTRKALELYRIDFVYENAIFDLRNETLKWCEKSAQELNRSLRTKRQVENGENKTTAITNDQLVDKIMQATSISEQLEQQAKNSLQTDWPHTIQDLKAEKIVLKDADIRFLSTQTLNDVIINDFLDNVIDTNGDGEWPNNIVLERTQIDTQVHPDKINGRNIEDVISTSDNLSIKNLIIGGETTFKEPVITETLNRIPFDDEHILMIDSDQSFRELNVDSVKVTNLNVSRVNDRDLEDVRDEIFNDKLIDQLATLKVDQFVVGDLMNGVDMRTLDKYALRVSGDQVITAKYFFEDLHVNNLEGEKLNQQRIEDLVRIDTGTYKMEAEVEFSKPLSVNNLTVMEALDKIPVKKGKLQVLRKDVKKKQYIKGRKVVKDVTILSPIKLQGNIKGMEVEKFNPVVRIDGPFVYEGDFVISGNTTIEKLLLAKDIRSADGNRSVQRVLSHGIPLDQKEIDIPIDFNQQLNVDEIFVDKINGVDPSTWVVTGTEEQQIIRGPKVFVNDVNVTGDTKFFKINNILVSDLENRILRKSGDQEISGRHTFVNVVANRVTGTNTLIGKNSWKNILTTDTKQVIFGTTVVNADVKANFTMAESVNVKGTTNGYDFTEIVEDTVLRNTDKPITGHKTFQDLTAVNLSIANMDVTKKRKFTIDHDVRLETASVENLHFVKSCNKVEADKFGTQLEEDPKQMVSVGTDFEDFIVFGDVYIESNRLGDMDLEEFERNSVKVDEEHTFESAIFDDTLISENVIELHGNVEKVDLENVVQSNSEDVVQILGHKTFLNNLTVFGSIVLEGDINDFNMAAMCKFSDLSEEGKQLKILGNALFVKGPQVHKILNTTVKSISDNAWFKNKAVSIDQEASFKNIIFRSNVTVKGTVDGVNLHTLEKEYFSKTKDQAITDGLYFANNVIFANNLICPSMAMNGEVNGMKIEELPRTVLLKDLDQVFEEVAYFENIVVEDLQGDFTVNNLSLETDLMRYDRQNVVTGTKRVNQLVAENIELKQNVAVQDVDLLDWMQNAVLKKGSFVVKSRMVLQGNVHFDKPLGLLGPLNGEMFTNETIMLKSKPQNVTGVKRFELKPMEMMKFRNVKLKGLLNDMQMSDLLEDQTGGTDMILKSPMHFYSDIYTKNINLMKPYKNVDINAFLSDLNDLEKTDLVEKYSKLLNMTIRLNRNLKEQGFYLQSYKDLQEIENPQYIVNSCCDKPTLMNFEYTNGSYALCYHYWDQDLNTFQKSVNLAVDMGYPPTKTEVFSLDRQQFLYMEYPTDPTEHPSEGLFRGQFWKVERLNHLIPYGSIVSNGIRQITPLQVEGSDCILVIYENVKSPHIFCEFNLGRMNLMQPLPQGKYIQSKFLKIDDISFLILLNSQEADTSTSQAGVEIWCMHDSQFGMRQVLYFSDPPPKSISAVTYNGFHYLSIVYRGGIHQGHIDILRYSKSSGNFEQWQKITSNNLVRGEFSVLPSGELFFFVLGPSNETLTIYKYVGISGFKEVITIPSSNDIRDFIQFTLGKKHFVMINTQDKLRILQAQFKGNTAESL